MAIPRAFAVVPGPVELLAGEDGEAVEVGDGGGDHAEESLARGEIGEEVRGAPAGENVGRDLHDGGIRFRSNYMLGASCVPV